MLALATSLQTLTSSVRRARSASWCSLMISLHRAPLPVDVAADVERLKAVDYDADPPSIKVMGPVTGTSAPPQA